MSSLHHQLPGGRVLYHWRRTGRSISGSGHRPGIAGHRLLAGCSRPISLKNSGGDWPIFDAISTAGMVWPGDLPAFRRSRWSYLVSW